MDLYLVILSDDASDIHTEIAGIYDWLNRDLMKTDIDSLELGESQYVEIFKVQLNQCHAYVPTTLEEIMR